MRFVRLVEPREEALGAKIVTSADRFKHRSEEMLDKANALLTPVSCQQAKRSRINIYGCVATNVNIDEIEFALVTIQLKILRYAHGMDTYTVLNSLNALRSFMVAS